MPMLKIQSMEGQEQLLSSRERRHQLILLWAGWCQPCLAELSELWVDRQSLSMAGIDLVPLNVDDMGQPHSLRREKAMETFRQLGLSPWGSFATPEALDVLDATQRCLTSKPTNRLRASRPKSCTG